MILAFLWSCFDVKSGPKFENSRVLLDYVIFCQPFELTGVKSSCRGEISLPQNVRTTLGLQEFTSLSALYFTTDCRSKIKRVATPLIIVQIVFHRTCIEPQKFHRTRKIKMNESYWAYRRRKYIYRLHVSICCVIQLIHFYG